MVASGHLTAAGRAVSYISPIGVVKELTEGLDYYDYISDLDDNFEDRYEELAVSLKLVLAELLTKEALIVSYTGKQDVTKLLGADLSRLSGKLNSKSAFTSEAAKPEVKNEGIKTASQVQYVAAAGNFLKDGLEYNGALVVLSTIFSYDYLWLNVRVKGGAYGCMCSFSRSGNAYLTSYRDPNLLETYEIYKKAPEYVKNFNCDDRDMTKYVIGAISKLDAPLTPVSEGNFSFVSWLMGLNDEDLQRERDQVLSCTNSDIQALEPYVRAIIDADTICVIGNEDKVEKVRDSFKNIISFL
jgi:Zn-dependent M16 (insulinase) family peptidase